MTLDMLPGRPYRLQTPQAALDDLRTRLERTRLPEQQAGPDWRTGTPLSYARTLRDSWLNDFDWRAWERRINRFEQRMVEIDGVTTHVLVRQGSQSAAVPLILTHGWPGSFLEFLDLIEPLAHPEQYGGRIEEAFTVVVPSLPGYGLSPAPTAPLHPDAVAGLWTKLMRDHFGFTRYCAYGSDWGSLVSASMARNHPDGLEAILLTSAGGRANLPFDVVPSDEEAAWQARMADRMREESAYQLLQGTKPQSLAYAQTDSPIGLVSWIAEKFQGWTKYGSGEPPPIPVDTIIANTMFYWLNGALAPMWFYMSLAGLKPIDTQRPDVPAGFLLAPQDCFAPAPRSVVERLWNVASYRIGGIGHFPGFDSPDVLLAALREMIGWRRQG